MFENVFTMSNRMAERSDGRKYFIRLSSLFSLSTTDAINKGAFLCECRTASLGDLVHIKAVNCSTLILLS